MEKSGCTRQANGLYKCNSNGNRVVKVQLKDGSVTQMTKSELNQEATTKGLRKYFYEDNNTYYLVSEDVYHELKRPEWREAKRNERNKKAYVLSCEKTADAGVKVPAHNETLVGNIYDAAEFTINVVGSPEDMLVNQERLDILYTVLDTLSARDREIIILFSNKYTDSQIGEKIGMSQRGVNKRRKAILSQLKELLGKIL